MLMGLKDSFDVKKLTLNFYSTESLLLFFCTKNGPINIESHIYKVTK